MFLLSPDGAWVTLPSSRVDIVSSTDLAIATASGVVKVPDALRGFTQLTGKGYAELVENGLVSGFFDSEEAASYLPEDYSLWEARWIADLIYHRHHGDRVPHILDLCSGYGRIALPLLRAGYRVDAVDLSRAGIAFLRDRARAEGLLPSLTAFVADAANFARPETYDVVVCVENSLRYLGSGSRVLRNLMLVADSLLPGGMYLVHIGLSLAPGTQSWEGADGGTITWTIEDVDETSGETVERVRTSDRQGRSTADDTQVQVALNGEHLVSMARKAGFQLTGAWSDSRRPLSLDTLPTFRGNCWFLFLLA